MPETNAKNPPKGDPDGRILRDFIPWHSQTGRLHAAGRSCSHQDEINCAWLSDHSFDSICRYHNTGHAACQSLTGAKEM